MDILILVKEKVDEEHLKLVLTNLREKVRKDFSWEVIRDVTDWKSRLSCFKILANGNDEGELVLYADLVWAAPSRFMKSAETKMDVFNDITNLVFPAFDKKVEKKTFRLSEKEIFQLLSKMETAETPFVVQAGNGASIGIGTRTGVDYSITHGDLASMLAAVVVFEGKCITLE